MKALSVKQPWATMEALGIKPLEIRSRRTNYRGPVMICSSQTEERDIERLRFGFANTVRALPAWRSLPDERLPLGQAICVVDLIDIRPMTPEDEMQAWVRYQEGLWAWIFENPRPLKPFPVKGRLGLWSYRGGCRNCDKGCEWAISGPMRDAKTLGDGLCWRPADSLFLTENQAQGGQAG